MYRLSDLNDTDVDGATRLLEPLIERAPHVAQRVARHRPFISITALKTRIRQELQNLDYVERISLFQSHPELAPENPESMTSESQHEQGRLDLTTLKSTDQKRLSELNSKYREKFGFPFITALARHRTLESVFTEFQTRMAKSQATEVSLALEQVCIVSAERVERTFSDADREAAVSEARETER